MDRVPIEADQLDADTIKKIEEAVAKLPSNLADPYKQTRVNGVPRQALLHPTHAEGRLQGQVFSLGDRVVYVQNSGKVDIATRGTVVGINTSTLDVLFDGIIMSGSTLGGRCSENRGAVVPKSSVLNLTNPTVVALSKAAKLRKPEAVPSGDNSRTASPTGQATRFQLSRTNGQAGRDRGGKWHTPWGINPPVSDSSSKASSDGPKQGSPFNPTVLLRRPQNSNVTVMQTPVQFVPHQYHNGVAIPPPANLDQQQRMRSGPPSKPPAHSLIGSPNDQSSHQSPRGTSNEFRGPRGGGRGGGRGGAANGSPMRSGRGGGRRGRGQGTARV